MLARLHYQLTKLAIRVGPSNPLLQFLLKRACQKHGCELIDRQDAFELRKGTAAMLVARSHFVYLPTLAERFDVYFTPVVPEWRDGVAVADYSRPRLHTYAKSGLQFELAAFPEEDDIIEAYFRWYRPKRGNCVFDVGAHCGVSTYFFSKLVGSTGRVIAFEPDTLNRSLLLRNIQRHGLTNVTVVNAALAGTAGHAEFYREGTIGSCFSRLSSRGTVGSISKVDTLTLADAFSRWGVPDLCKIDIEGAEIEVIAAAAELLARTKTHFTLDTSHVLRGRLTAPMIEKLFRAYGFDVESAPVGGMMTTWARPSPLEGADEAYEVA